MNEASSFRRTMSSQAHAKVLATVSKATILGLSAKQVFCEETRRGTIVHSHQIRYLFSISLMWLMLRNHFLRQSLLNILADHLAEDDWLRNNVVVTPISRVVQLCMLVQP
jgi:hypothetical protein